MLVLIARYKLTVRVQARVTTLRQRACAHSADDVQDYGAKQHNRKARAHAQKADRPDHCRRADTML